MLGQVFRHDIVATGLWFDTPPAASGPGTARCLILVTPDGQRTMATYLGACVELGPEDIDIELIGAAQITYLEGYLFDPPRPRRRSARGRDRPPRRPAGRAEPVRPVLRRSPPRRVPRAGDGRGRYPVRQRGRDLLALRNRGFRAGCGGGARPCRGRRADPQRAWQRRARPRGAYGQGEAHDVAASPVEHVSDTTGAGDLYAAGFLHGLTRGLPLATCGALGSLCAAEIISHVGARPEASLRELVAASGYV